jgi:hypothetical protein
MPAFFMALPRCSCVLLAAPNIIFFDFISDSLTAPPSALWASGPTNFLATLGGTSVLPAKEAYMNLRCFSDLTGITASQTTS